jgi:16S rRNA (uracil1498-N3)-methyltransferase
MRLSRIFTSQHFELDQDVRLEDSAGHYLTRVLRLSKGDDFVLFNGDGLDYPAVISEIRSQQVFARVAVGSPAGNESPLKITLVQAVCRGERMDYVLQKATELGVFRIQPLISQRVEVRLDAGRQQKRMTHWRGVVTSACEQSGRAVVPEVWEPLPVSDWLSGVNDAVRLVLDPLAGHSLAGLNLEGDRVAVLVGPEGGFTDDEMKLFRASGLTAVSLGPRVLRTETAGPAAIAVLQARSGDF